MATWQPTPDLYTGLIHKNGPAEVQPPVQRHGAVTPNGVSPGGEMHRVQQGAGSVLPRQSTRSRNKNVFLSCLLRLSEDNPSLKKCECIRIS